MDLYRFRILIDDASEAFRDVEIRANATFFDLHRAILDAFEFKGQEMASFYVSDDDWERGHEVPLMDMGMLDDGTTAMTMENVMIGDHVEKADQKFIYVYDFLNMWLFYVELVKTEEAENPPTGQAGSPEFAKVVFSHNDAPLESTRTAGFDLEDIDLSEEESGEFEEVDDDALEDLGDIEEFK